jgi:hypothetical protein
MDQVISYKELEEELKSHDFKLVTYSNDELKIKGIASITPFMIAIMSVIGICLVLFGMISIFAIAKPEYVAGVLLSLAGVVLMILPFYNYFSKSYFEINFRRPDKSLIIKNLNPLPFKKIVKFEDITALHLKKNTLNSYVNDTSKSSFIYNYSISVKLKDNTHNSLIQFSKRDEKIEIFSNHFTDMLAQLTGVVKEFEPAN